MIFYPGLHQPSDAKHFARCMVSLSRLVVRTDEGRIARRVSDNALRVRRAPLGAGAVMIDPQAYTILQKYGAYTDTPHEYAEVLEVLAQCNRIVSATSQDYVCDDTSLNRTGKSVAEHMRLTIERYDELKGLVPGQVYLMPVLHGRTPRQYVQHLEAYGARLEHGAWVGVGSIARLSRDTLAVRAILLAIKAERPDLRLHGFGLSFWALRSGRVRALLHSADSVAWSLTARREGRNGNDWREGEAFTQALEQLDELPAAVR